MAAQKSETPSSTFGPLWESKQDGSKHWWTFRPFISVQHDHDGGRKEIDILYPVFNKTVEPHYEEWHFLKAVKQVKSPTFQNFYLFPLYFDAESTDPASSHRGLFPVGGTISQFLGNERVRWWMFPLYAQTENGQSKKRYTPWPFIQHGDGDLSGWGIWPLYGKFIDQNGNENAFYLWPFAGYTKRVMEDGQERSNVLAIPFYHQQSTPSKENTSYVYPFFGRTEQAQPVYEETRYLWPLFVQGKGQDGRYTNRWAPFYSKSYYKGLEKKWVMWPAYKQTNWIEKDYLLTKTQWLYVLYWDVKQRPVDNLGRKPARMTHIWPLFSRWTDGNGREQWQAVSPLEPFFPHNEKIRFIYSPLFSVIKREKDIDFSSWNVLWKLWSYERDAGKKRWAIGPVVESSKSEEYSEKKILKGLLGTKKKEGKRTFTFLWKEFHL